ncbi:MAG: hypothetical protein SPI86_02595 [Treponemataceae bacterium]|nr:hypothetical protein [Spirochaetales bacterium]MDY6030631.1 hypothetical protein [Treponemataceae bacterium]
MKKTNQKFIYGLIFLSVISIFLTSCGHKKTLRTVDQIQLFTLNYGNYEDELRLEGNGQFSPINSRIVMKDGFFYVTDDYAKKIMQFTSYGDLTSIIYRQDTNPEPSFIHKIGKGEINENGIKSATQSAQTYDFNAIQDVTVDSHKNIFVVDQISSERQEIDTEENILLREIVLNFSRDGVFKGYYGQEGLGGTPFPTITNIFITNNDELVVVCIPRKENFIVYWFNQNGSLKWKIPVKNSFLPQSETENSFVSIEKIIPDYSSPILYIKADYYKVSIDEELNVQSGIDYQLSLMHQFNIEKSDFEQPFEIPPYEDVITDRFSKLIYKIPYNFLGVNASGNFFFLMPDETGLVIQIMMSNGQRAIKRHIKYDTISSVHTDFSVSQEGIISGLIAGAESTQIVWWRTDSLVDR